MSPESSSRPPDSEVPGFKQDHSLQEEKHQECPSQNHEEHPCKQQHQHPHPHEHEEQRPHQHQHEEEEKCPHQHEQEYQHQDHQQQSSNQFQQKQQHDLYGAGQEEQKYQQQQQQEEAQQQLAHQNEHQVTSQNRQQLTLEYRQHPICAEPINQYHHHPHNVHYTHQHPHHDHHTPHQHQQHPYPQHQQHMKGETVPFYQGAVGLTSSTVTNQMQLNSPSVQVCASVLSPANLQVSQQQESPIAQHAYPLPLATHEEVVNNRELFFSTLTKLHATLGTKLSIPRIGGKDLDLHLLYKEVTAHGGHVMITKDRKWKAITLVFNFPSTTTSASHVLKKHYDQLLRHYERVYFQTGRPGVLLREPVMPLSVPEDTVYPSSCVPAALEYTQSPLEVPAYGKKQKIDSGQVLGVDPASFIGSVVTGYIKGKFENCYVASVNVGGEPMESVLWHPAPSSTIPQGATVSVFGKEYETTLMEHQTECSRKKKMSRKDPKAPRQNKTAYNFFFAKQRAMLKSTQPDKDRAISKMIGDMWNQLSENEKSPYRELGSKEKERYKREMCKYKETQRLEARSLVIRKNDSPNGLRHMGTKDEHITHIDVNKVSSTDIKQESIPYQEHNTQPLSESSISISSSSNETFVSERKHTAENQGM